MGEVIDVQDRLNERQEESQSAFHRIAGFVGLSQYEREALTVDQRKRLSRYVGNLALVAGNFFDDNSMEEAMERSADTLEREGFLRNPERPFGIRVLWKNKAPDSMLNQQLLKGSDVLREALQRRGVAAHVSPRGEYPYGTKGSERRRVLEALNRSTQDFERLLKYHEDKPEPEVGDLGMAVLIDTNWAARAFSGINVNHMRHDDGLVVLHGAGPQPEDFRWTSPSVLESIRQSYD